MVDLRNQNQVLLTTQVELLNRLQAQDFTTFSAMQYQTSSAVNSDGSTMAPRTDEGELMQLQGLYQTNGYGETIFGSGLAYDPIEELREYLPEV